ncbi:TonB C-terminal domain-containing protein [Candidatus Pseudothioglobus singularis]|nr:TonB C-terminal domain-containing protein [Candidatus Pseudothioglobus singularis]MDB4846999.1 TonB C-terminal domain-containing protein [Candidatus Pseudothioglobus singularis]
MKEKLLDVLKLLMLSAFYILFIVIWQEIRWLGIILLIIISPLFCYIVYEIFKDMHQSNLDDIQEQLNIVQDTWIEDISDRVRNNWDLNSTKVVPYDRWDCRIYIQQDEDGNVLDTEIQECSVRDKRRANRIKKSLVQAVLKTSPLPLPEEENVFTRQIYFGFSKT